MPDPSTRNLWFRGIKWSDLPGLLSNPRQIVPYIQGDPRSLTIEFLNLQGGFSYPMKDGSPADILLETVLGIDVVTARILTAPYGASAPAPSNPMPTDPSVMNMEAPQEIRVYTSSGQPTGLAFAHFHVMADQLIDLTTSFLRQPPQLAGFLTDRFAQITTYINDEPTKDPIRIASDQIQMFRYEWTVGGSCSPCCQAQGFYERDKDGVGTVSLNWGVWSCYIGPK